MKKVLAVVISVWGMTGLGAFAADPPAKTDAPASTASELSTDELKIAYTIGFANGTNALRYRLRPNEWAAFLQGLQDAHAKLASKTDAELWRPKVQPFVQARDAESAAENKKLGAEALAKAAAEPGARKLPSGLVMKTVKEGTGATPAGSDQVKVKYSGKLVNGTEFDNSEKHGGSSTFVLAGVIPCWTEALKLMKVGETADLYCPPELAYGDRGAGPVIPGGSTLHFTVELLEVTPPPSAGAPAATTPKQTP